MTTIIASRAERLIASDSLTTDSDGGWFYSRKVVAVADGVVAGAAGAASDCDRFFSWLRDGGKAPKKMGGGFRGVTVDAVGITVFYPDMAPLRVDQDFLCIGSGGDAAHAALICGRSVMDAIKVASEVNRTMTGGAIQFLKVEDARWPEAEQ